MIFSCCVNTFKRPILLEKLLKSLTEQKLAPDWVLEIIIVDNDPLKMGEKVVSKVNSELGMRVKYFSQPEKNIALTRNVGVSNASGEYILFIDDDGYADVNWIYELKSCMDRYKADGVFGTVIPYFDSETPTWLQNGGFFERTIQESGEISKYKRTGNCLIKKSCLLSVAGPFDPKFGLTGGEDSSLFGILESKGAKFVFCKEAVVFDFVPRERANLKWLMLRNFRSGRGFTQNQVTLSGNKVGTSVLAISKASVFLVTSGLFYVISLPFKVHRNKWLLKIMSNLGHLAAFTSIEYIEYK